MDYGPSTIDFITRLLSYGQQGIMMKLFFIPQEVKLKANIRRVEDKKATAFWLWLEIFCVKGISASNAHQCFFVGLVPWVSLIVRTSAIA